MKKTIFILGVCFLLAATTISVRSQTTATTDQSIQGGVSDLQTMLETIESVPPLPASQLPESGTFWSAQHAPGTATSWPPMPCDIWGLDAWPLGDGQYLLNDTNLDYDALAAVAQAAQTTSASPMMQMSMMASSYAYGNPVYLTNIAASFAPDGSITASFDIIGGTNFVPYDILMTTNLAMPVSSWSWLGIAYTSNNYTLTTQPADLGFYILAKPSQTMTVGIGDDTVGQCDVPYGLTNAIQVTGGGGQSLALLNNGTVVAWGQNAYGEGSVPTNLTGVAMISAGWYHNVALLTSGTVTAWGLDVPSLGYYLTNVPPDLTNATVVSAQALHTLALRSNGTVIAWGDDTYGQTNVVSGLSKVKFIAGGADFSLAVQFSTTVMYPVNVAQDLLLIYNTNSTDSATVLNYYLAHRPMVSGANVLGIGYSGIFVTNGGLAGHYAFITNTTVYETITSSGFTNQILTPVQTWLNNNPTKRPQYVILFLDVPSRVDDSATTGANYPFGYGDIIPSVSCQLATDFPGWSPFVTHINMNGTNDCIAYLNKLADMDTNNSLVISACERNYGNTNYIVDDSSGIDSLYLTNAITGLFQNGVPLSSIIFASRGQSHITLATNVAGYISWGQHSGFPPTYAIDGTVQFSGNSGWYPIETIESYNGQRYRTDQGTFITWFSSNAFGGTNYSNTPVGAVSHVDEPREPGVNNCSVYFGLWAAGKDFAVCAWNSRMASLLQAVGDPFVTK